MLQDSLRPNSALASVLGTRAPVHWREHARLDQEPLCFLEDGAAFLLEFPQGFLTVMALAEAPLVVLHLCNAKAYALEVIHESPQLGLEGLLDLV